MVEDLFLELLAHYLKDQLYVFVLLEQNGLRS